MIYTTFGLPVEIVGRNEELSETYVLVRAKDGWEQWRPLHTLKADDGIKEIMTAADKAPEYVKTADSD